MEFDSRCIIKLVKAREILDSRGNPTIEAEVYTDSGVRAVASAPSGASTGGNEALELRDGDSKRFLGKGVLQAKTNINEKISLILAGRSCDNQEEIDYIMVEADGTDNMQNLGANATTAVSIACAKAAAKAKGVPLYQHISDLFTGLTKKRQSTNAALPTMSVTNTALPTPLMNIINGGKHAGSGLAIQEFMIAPVGAKTFSESVKIGSEIYYKLASILSDKLGDSAVNVGDEGGFAPSIKDTESVLSYISDAVSGCGYSVGTDILLGIDCAANSFWNPITSKYTIDGKSLKSDGLLDYYISLCDRYPIRIIEDPFIEDDLDSFAKITAGISKKTYVVGDDIFVTDKSRVQKGLDEQVANSMIVKVNQVGTLTTAMEAVCIATSKSWLIIASHRSGETNDDWLADFSVGINAGAIKAGAPARGERVAKYNRLMYIEQMSPKLSFCKPAF
ncbi:MAG: phosphopyruvate hydratase [Nitrososphaeraceae archaeon]|nr:phosphopyruvate hydratase [Nitrososphaeraceae archaeon]